MSELSFLRTQKRCLALETLSHSVPVSLDNENTVAIKANRELLKREVVALESGREDDVDTLTTRNLSCSTIDSYTR